MEQNPLRATNPPIRSVAGLPDWFNTLLRGSGRKGIMQSEPLKAKKKDGGAAAHLVSHQFPKGQSGNPAGRPKGRTVTAELRKLLETEVGGKSTREQLAEILVNKALSGDYKFILEVLKRVDGNTFEEEAVEE